MTKNYDEKCYDLAEMFLGDHPNIDTFHNIHELASSIQEAIDSWIEDRRAIAPSPQEGR